MSSRKPSGPLRHKNIDTNRPTTTGGSPMPVLTNATATLRPGNRSSARAIPGGIPSTSDMKVAAPEILIDSHVIVQTSASKPKTISNALAMPCQMSSMLSSEIFLFPVSDGNEQRLTELLYTKISDDGLGLRRDQEIGERFSARLVDLRAIGGVHFHHGVNIQEQLVAFEANRETQQLAEG